MITRLVSFRKRTKHQYAFLPYLFDGCRVP